MAPGSCPPRPCCAGTLGVWNIPPPAANLCSHPTCQHGLDLLPGKPGRLVLLPVPHRGQEAKTPQPWGLGKLGVGMVLQGGPTHSVSPSLSLSQGLRVLQGMCRALGCCSLTLAQAAWSLVSCGRTKHGPGGQGAGEGVGHSQVCTWDRRRPSPHWPAGGDSLSHTHSPRRRLALGSSGPRDRFLKQKPGVAGGSCAIQPFPGPPRWANTRC